MNSQLSCTGYGTVKSGFLNHFARRITPAIPKPEGFTEYSRRQSPRFLRATPPVSHPPRTTRPERAQEFFANLNPSPFSSPGGNVYDSNPGETLNPCRLFHQRKTQPDHA